LTLIDLLLGTINSESKIAAVGEFEQLPGFQQLEIEMYPSEQGLADDERPFDLILCSNLQQLNMLKTRLTEHGVLVAFPPFGLNRELQYHGRLGVHYNTPRRLRYMRDHQGDPRQKATVVS
jgi:hypothetical protein